MIIENIKTLFARIKVSEIKVIALTLLIAFISGCSKAPIPATFIEHTTFTNADWYMVHYELKTEQWNDPEVLSTPRVQFVWAAPDTPEEDDAIWSMRTDGTDLRQVVSPERRWQFGSGLPFLDIQNQAICSILPFHVMCFSRRNRCYDYVIFPLKSRR